MSSGGFCARFNITSKRLRNGVGVPCVGIWQVSPYSNNSCSRSTVLMGMVLGQNTGGCMCLQSVGSVKGKKV